MFGRETFPSYIAELPFDMLDGFPHLGVCRFPHDRNVLLRLLAASCHKCIGASTNLALSPANGGALSCYSLLAATQLVQLTALPTGARLCGGSLADGVGFALGLEHLLNGFLRQDHTFFLSYAVGEAPCARDRIRIKYINIYCTTIPS